MIPEGRLEIQKDPELHRVVSKDVERWAKALFGASGCWEGTVALRMSREREHQHMFISSRSSCVDVLATSSASSCAWRLPSRPRSHALKA